MTSQMDSRYNILIGKGVDKMQDDYNRMIRRSMQQAQCGYEDIFAEVADENAACAPPASLACGRSQDACDGGCTQDKMYRPGCELPVMVFIEPQSFGRLYNEAEGFRQGTLFPALNKPFCGRGGNG